jgi:MFS family permease
LNDHLTVCAHRHKHDVMTAFTRYRVALTVPGMARVMAAAFVCRLLAGMVVLALLLVVHRTTGSYASAGVVSGAYAVALAFTSPLWGRIADRRGPRAALATASVLQSCFFALFVLVAAAQPWPPALIVLAFLAGACTPPAAAISNTVIAKTTGDDEAKRTLFSLSGLLTETVFIVGPLIVAGVVTVLAPIYAVVVTAVTSAAGTWWLRSAPAVRAIEFDRSAHIEGLVLHRNPRLAHMLAVVVLAAFSLGALEVSLIAHADALRMSAGVLLAAMACGGAVGSFLYGGLRLPGSPLFQLVGVLTLFGLLVLTVGLGPGVVATLVVLAFAGAVNGPADALTTMLVGDYSTANTKSQAFAVLIAANWIGFAAGNGAAGVLVERYSPGVGAAAAAVTTIVAAGSLLVPLTRQRTPISR